MPWFYVGSAAGCVLAGWVLAMLHHRYHARQPHPGVHDGRLLPCPPTPNCVCTQDAATRPPVAALTFRGSPAEALQRLKTILALMPRSRIVSEADDYLHAEVRSLLFRFVDDVEFLIDDAAKLIHFRSAARSGSNDFSVNRRRMETIRRAFVAE